MSKETKLLNLFCVIASFGFLAAIVFVFLSTKDLLSTDNLFIITVCLVLALTFAINPLLYLKAENRLPIPFLKSKDQAQLGSKTPPLLDAKGRAVPPDVRAMVGRFSQSETKDA